MNVTDTDDSIKTHNETTDDMNDDGAIQRCKKPSFSKINSFVSTKSFDLEWDKHADFNQIIEPDNISTYDLNARMAEILAQRFLDFEMSTYGGDMTSVKSFPLHLINSFQSFDVGSEFEQESMNSDLTDNASNNDTDTTESVIKRKSSIRLGYSMRKRGHRRANTNGSMTSNISATSDPHTAEETPSDCFTLDDLFRMKLLSNDPPGKPFTYEPITFDLESLYSAFQTSYSMNQKFLSYLFSSSYQNFHHSMPDLTRLEESCQLKLKSKHLSLPNISKSYDIIYIKPEPIKLANSIAVQAEIVEEKISSLSLPQPPSEEIKRTSSISYSRLSRLEMLRNYVSRLGERIKQILTEAFQSDTVTSSSTKSSYNQNNRNFKFSQLKELYSIDESDERSYDIIESAEATTTTTLQSCNVSSPPEK